MFSSISKRQHFRSILHNTNQPNHVKHHFITAGIDDIMNNGGNKIKKFQQLIGDDFDKNDSGFQKMFFDAVKNYLFKILDELAVILGEKNWQAFFHTDSKLVAKKFDQIALDTHILLIYGSDIKDIFISSSKNLFDNVITITKWFQSLLKKLPRAINESISELTSLIGKLALYFKKATLKVFNFLKSLILGFAEKFSEYLQNIFTKYRSGINWASQVVQIFYERAIEMHINNVGKEIYDPKIPDVKGRIEFNGSFNKFLYRVTLQVIFFLQYNLAFSDYIDPNDVEIQQQYMFSELLLDLKKLLVFFKKELGEELLNKNLNNRNIFKYITKTGTPYDICIEAIDILRNSLNSSNRISSYALNKCITSLMRGVKTHSEYITGRFTNDIIETPIDKILKNIENTPKTVTELNNRLEISKQKLDENRSNLKEYTYGTLIKRYSEAKIMLEKIDDYQLDINERIKKNKNIRNSISNSAMNITAIFSYIKQEFSNILLKKNSDITQKDNVQLMELYMKLGPDVQNIFFPSKDHAESNILIMDAISAVEIFESLVDVNTMKSIKFKENNTISNNISNFIGTKHQLIIASDSPSIISSSNINFDLDFEQVSSKIEKSFKIAEKLSGETYIQETTSKLIESLDDLTAHEFKLATQEANLKVILAMYTAINKLERDLVDAELFEPSVKSDKNWEKLVNSKVSRINGLTREQYRVLHILRGKILLSSRLLQYINKISIFIREYIAETKNSLPLEKDQLISILRRRSILEESLPKIINLFNIYKNRLAWYEALTEFKEKRTWAIRIIWWTSIVGAGLGAIFIFSVENPYKFISESASSVYDKFAYTFGLRKPTNAELLTHTEEQLSTYKDLLQDENYLKKLQGDVNYFTKALTTVKNQKKNIDDARTVLIESVYDNVGNTDIKNCINDLMNAAELSDDIKDKYNLVMNPGWVNKPTDNDIKNFKIFLSKRITDITTSTKLPDAVVESYASYKTVLDTAINVQKYVKKEHITEYAFKYNSQNTSVVEYLKTSLNELEVQRNFALDTQEAGQIPAKIKEYNKQIEQFKNLIEEAKKTKKDYAVVTTFFSWFSWGKDKLKSGASNVYSYIPDNVKTWIETQTGTGQAFTILQANSNPESYTRQLSKKIFAMIGGGVGVGLYLVFIGVSEIILWMMLGAGIFSALGYLYVRRKLNYHTKHLNNKMLRKIGRDTGFEYNVGTIVKDTMWELWKLFNYGYSLSGITSFYNQNYIGGAFSLLGGIYSGISLLKQFKANPINPFSTITTANHVIASADNALSKYADENIQSLATTKSIIDSGLSFVPSIIERFKRPDKETNRLKAIISLVRSDIESLEKSTQRLTDINKSTTMEKLKQITTLPLPKILFEDNLLKQKTESELIGHVNSVLREMKQIQTKQSQKQLLQTEPKFLTSVSKTPLNITFLDNTLNASSSSSSSSSSSNLLTRQPFVTNI